MADGDVYDTPGLPVGWTAQGCDQTGLAYCEYPDCGEVFHEEQMVSHLWLTHRIIIEERDDGTRKAQHRP